jgi:hypothetical protein
LQQTKEEREKEREDRGERERKIEGRERNRGKEKKRGEGVRENQYLRGKNLPLRFYKKSSKMTTNADSEAIEKFKIQNFKIFTNI